MKHFESLKTKRGRPRKWDVSRKIRRRKKHKEAIEKAKAAEIAKLLVKYENETARTFNKLYPEVPQPESTTLLEQQPNKQVNV